MFEKNWNMSFLLDFYGDMLGDRKRDILSYYYNEDLSLSEIAEEVGISRQGVRDCIKKAEEELIFWEEKLHLAERFRTMQEQLDHIRALADSLVGCDETALHTLQAELESLSQNLK